MINLMMEIYGKLLEHYSKEFRKINIKDYMSSNLTSMIGNNSNPK